MMMRTLVAASLVGGAAWAEAPKVATDIAPVHGLVSQVMAGVGTPALVIPQEASPHGYSMRPSEARALSEADLVVWVGPMLSPWLEDRIETLAGTASHLTLMEVAGTATLPFREIEDFGTGHGHDHDHDHDHGHKEEHDDHARDDHAHDEHDHAAHDDHDHEAHGEKDHAAHDDHDHEDHAEAHDDHDDHGHDHAGGVDPHVWLDPANARLFLTTIAAELSKIDPDHADTYQANAAAAVEALLTQEAALAEKLAASEAVPILVYHDAYAYFEARFGLQAVGAVNWADGTDASAGQLATVREAVAESGASCVFIEPQVREGLVDAVMEDSAFEMVIADPIGRGIPLGAAYYPTLLENLGAAAARCLK